LGLLPTTEGLDVTNLLDETLHTLQKNGKAPEDVLWVGSADGEFSLPWDDFARIADVEYYSGFGANEVPTDLVVVGATWWLSRWEYDGSEGWTFNKRPTRARSSKRYTVVVPGPVWGIFVDSLENAQKPTKYDDV
jgi:hypothetical protein